MTRLLYTQQSLGLPDEQFVLTDPRNVETLNLIAGTAAVRAARLAFINLNAPVHEAALPDVNAKLVAKAPEAIAANAIRVREELVLQASL